MTEKSTYDYHQDHSLSEKWKFRFNFFEKHGLPGFWFHSPAWKAAAKTMSIGERIRVNANIFAFFFSVIYLLILGLWKKAIMILILNVVVIIISVMLNVTFLGIVVNLITTLRTNLWFYELKVKGIQTWSL